MALLGKIRQYGVLMMALIVVAVFGFLFMDVSSVGRGFGGPSNILGSVAGVDITRDEMDANVSYYEGMGAVNDEQTRDYVWKELVSDLIFRIQSKKLGIKISEKELEDMFVGENISPVVMQAMNGQADRASLEQARNNYLQVQDKKASERAENEQKYFEYWQTIEKRATAERVSSKYLNLIAKSNYAPGWMTNAEYARNSRSYDFNYVRIMYTDVPNSEVKVSDEEMKAYIKENAKKYEREANVSIDYVMFDVFPTAEDTAAYKERMVKVAEEFAKTNEDTIFISNNRGKLDAKYYTKTDWTDPDYVKDTLFGMKKADVFGPYLDNEGNFKVVKVMETKQMPDSIRCRHIFKPADRRDINSQRQAAVLLDSLKNLLVAGKANFDSLVLQNTMDGASREKGGDIGWRKKGDAYGEMFENYLFNICEKDSFEIVPSAEGVHLVQVTDLKIGNTKGMRIASITEAIIPSTATEDRVKSKANEFMANNRKIEDFQKAIKENPSLKKASASGLQISDYSLNEQIKGSIASEIIRWAHKEAKVGVVAEQIYALSDAKGNFVSQVLVPVLVSKSKKGLATIEDPNIKAEVEKLVRNKKKAELISKKLQGVSSLDAVVQQYSGSKIETASAVSYSSPFIPGIGVEPKVLGAAEALEANKVSSPVAGTEAVYVIQVTNRRDGPPMSNIAIARKSVSERMLPVEPNQMRETVSEALKDKLNVKDKRADSY